MTDPRDDRATDKDRSPITRRRMLQRASGLIATAAFSTRRRACWPWAGRVRARLHRQRPISRAGWPATWWPLGTGIFRPTSSAKASIGSSTRLERWSRALVSNRAKRRSGSSGDKVASRRLASSQRTSEATAISAAAGQRDVRPFRTRPTISSRSTKAHPGCAVVPAALAMAERSGGSGLDVLKAVVLG
mgnify:CR=1 FL=1